MNYFVYILLSARDLKFYIGYTTNLQVRFQQHAEGKVASTAKRRPLHLIYYERYSNQEDARRNEKYYKTTKGRNDLRKKLATALSVPLPKE